MNLKALLFLAAGHFVTDINTGALPAFLPFIKEFFNLSYTMTATIILTFNITSSVIQPIFGYFTDRWPARWLLPMGVTISALGLALIGWGSSYGWILFFTSISGFGQAIFHPESFKTVNILSGPKKATGISLFHCGGNLGFAMGPFLAIFFYQQLGLRGSSLFLLPGLIMLTIFLTTSHWRVREDFVAPKILFPQQAVFRSGRGLPMILLILGVVLRAGTRLGLLTFVPFYFIKILNTDPLIAGKYLTVFLLAGTTGIVVGGPFADRYGYKPTLLASLGLTPIFLFLFYMTQGIVSLACFAVAGFLLISSNSITMAMGQSFMPQNMGMASGLILGLAQGIAGIGATVLGWVADHWGLPATLQIIFLLPLIAFLIFLFLPYSQQHKKTSPN